MATADETLPILALVYRDGRAFETLLQGPSRRCVAVG